MRRAATTAGLILIGLLTGFWPRAAWAAENQAILLLNGGAEKGKGELPSVWFAARVPAKGLRMFRATDQAKTGKASLAIFNEHQYKETVANNWAQRLQQVPAGKTLILSAYIRTENADSVNVCLQCWSLGGKEMLAFTSTPVFRGDQEWILVRSGRVTVPAKTAFIIVRAVLAGKGKAWFDDISVAVQGPATQPEEAIAPEDLAKLAGGRIVKALPITKDCMVLAYLPSWAHGNVDNIAVANNDGGVRTLLAWPEITPQEASRADRRFVLALYSRKTTLREPAGTIGAHELLADWPELTSWKTKPRFATKPAATFKFVPGEGWKLFDVTDLVRAQAGDRRKACGVMLRFDREDVVSAMKWSGYAFVSREGIGQWLNSRPVLLVIEPSKKPTTEPAPKTSE